MRKLFITLLVLASILVSAGAGAAPQVGRDEAVALVREAAHFLTKNGREKAIIEFNKASSPFVKGDFYIVLSQMDGVILAHGANPRLIGKNLYQIKDSDGKYFVREQIELAKSKGSGWVEFRWPNPVSKVIELKSVYVEKVDDLIVAGGIYGK